MKAYQQSLIDLVGCNGSRTVAEVGVLRGETSRLLLETFGDVTVCMVDTWEEADEESDYYKSGDTCAQITQEQHDVNRKAAYDVASDYPGRALIYFCPSVVSPCIINKQIDLAFLDADHSYDAIMADMKSWWNWIVPDGIMCGHDYDNGPRCRGFGVKKAVDRFAQKRHLHVDVLPGAVWAIRK